jgi:subtilase family serine protease
MKAKDRIDSFIGFLPDLLKTIYNNPTYLVYRNIAQNNAYWMGYIKAKTELRNKLYEKEDLNYKGRGSIYPRLELRFIL